MMRKMHILRHYRHIIEILNGSSYISCLDRYSYKAMPYALEAIKELLLHPNLESRCRVVRDLRLSKEDLRIRLHRRQPFHTGEELRIGDVDVRGVVPTHRRSPVSPTYSRRKGLETSRFPQVLRLFRAHFRLNHVKKSSKRAQNGPFRG